jgi:hypothetical protein
MILKKWMPVLGKDHAQTSNLERDDDWKTNHLALAESAARYAIAFRLARSACSNLRAIVALDRVRRTGA